jgi:Rps23 Pro-64 3,4-dihydroxylase Tpa1-like proline 4-hydroxylase
METRRLTVDSKSIVVLDDSKLGADFDMFHHYVFNAASFTLSQGDTYESINEVGPYWAFKIDNDKFASSSLSATILDLVKKYYKDLSWQFTKIHVNSLQYGDSGFVHTDGDILPEHNVTATVLVYLNAVWEPNWFGETIFYNDNNDAEAVVSPNHKRIVIFDGSIKHSARPPSRICSFRRMNLVIKMSAKE